MKKYIESIVGVLAFLFVVVVFQLPKEDAKTFYFWHDRAVYMYCFIMSALYFISNIRLYMLTKLTRYKVQAIFSGLFTFVTAWNEKDMVIGDPHHINSPEIVFGIIAIVSLFITLINVRNSTHRQ